MIESTRPPQLESGPDDEPLEIHADDPRVVALSGKYVVEYTRSLSTTVSLRLTADDVAQMLMDVGCDDLEFAQDDITDALIIKGENVAPRGICAPCAGYGHREWSRDVGHSEPTSIVNDEGRVIWEDRS